MVTQSVGRPVTPSKIVGVSAWTRQVHQEISQVAGHNANVMITGPTGTGKEMIARAIHEQGVRSDKPFIPINCASLTGPLFESRMFGHEKGAFTGAHHAAIGCMRAADGGTLFLDEIGDMELDLQSKLLRALQERAVMSVGGTDEIPVDARLIVATNRDLKRDVIAGDFREDLYFRINVISLTTQPLRQRPEDTELLASRFLATLAVHHGVPLKRLSRQALRMLQSYSWPGNVRELRNFVERAVLLSKSQVIGEDIVRQFIDESFVDSWGTRDVPVGRLPENDRSEPGYRQRRSELLSTGSSGSERPIEVESGWRSMDEVERIHIRETLENTFYNQSAAARLLKRNRQWLVRKIKQHGLDVSQSRPGRPRGRQ
jgi:DNA-binding NtrC family response regulator